jgi:resuscitation-promoting factor RpfB
LFLTKILASRKLAAVAAALIFLTTAGAGVGYAALVKDVSLSVDGEVTDVRGMHATVGDLLASEGIEIGEHDVVQPAPTAKVKDGQTVVVRYGRQLRVNVDGTMTTYWTTATTLDAAIRDLGLRLEGAELSTSRSRTLGREGLALAVTMPKEVTLTADGKTEELSSTDRTVAALLSNSGFVLGKDDIVTPALGTVLSPGLEVVVKRVEVEEKTETVAIAFKTVEEKSGDLFTGERKTKTEGAKGSKDITTEYTYTDGEVTDEKVVSEKVTKEPTDRVILVGTKARPAPAPAAAPSPTPAPSRSSSSSSTPPSAGNTSGAGLNLANEAMWDRIAQCESGGRWNINTGNGYYGGLQFNYNTWLSVGGADFAPRADLASRAEQITVANRLYAQRGLQPWGCRHAA